MSSGTRKLDGLVPKSQADLHCSAHRVEMQIIAADSVPKICDCFTASVSLSLLYPSQAKSR